MAPASPHRVARRRTLLAVALAASLTGALGACAGPSGDTAHPGSPSASSSPAASSAASPTASSTPGSTGTASAGAESTTRPSGAIPVVPPARASTQPVRLLGPVEDAPGAVIPLVATVAGAPSGHDVRFSVGVPGGAGSCEGPQWVHAKGVSQRCWISLPRTGRRVELAARADFVVASGAPAATTAGVAPADGTVHVALRGPVTEPVDAATREALEGCGTPRGQVRLSFDDGFLDAARMRRMLAALDAANVRAWFFPTGGWAKEHPDLMAQLRASGHHIGSHTVTHPFLNRLGDAALAHEVGDGPAPAGGTALIRPGFGAGSFSQRTVAAAKARGLSVCYWSTDTRDWAGRRAEQITDAVLHGDEFSAPARSGSMVLGHMTGRRSSEAIPGIVAGLRRQGLSIEPLR